MEDGSDTKNLGLSEAPQSRLRLPKITPKLIRTPSQASQKNPVSERQVIIKGLNPSSQSQQNSRSHAAQKTITTQDLKDPKASEYKFIFSQNKLTFKFQGRITKQKGFEGSTENYLECQEEKWLFIGELIQHIYEDTVYVYPKSGRKRFYLNDRKLYDMKTAEWEKLRADRDCSVTAETGIFKNEPNTNEYSELYYGQIKRGKYHGLGVLYGEGFIYRGQFAQGRFSGYGKLLIDPVPEQPSNVVIEGKWNEAGWNGNTLTKLPKELVESPYMEFIRKEARSDGNGEVIRSQRMLRTDDEAKSKEIQQHDSLTQIPLRMDIQRS